MLFVCHPIFSFGIHWIEMCAHVYNLYRIFPKVLSVLFRAPYTKHSFSHLIFNSIGRASMPQISIKWLRLFNYLYGFPPMRIDELWYTIYIREKERYIERQRGREREITWHLYDRVDFRFVCCCLFVFIFVSLVCLFGK